MLNDLKVNQINIGADFINNRIKTISTVTNKTSNSVELFNRADRNNRYLTGEKDADGIPVMSGRMKGVDSKNWYTISEFNKLFLEIN